MFICIFVFTLSIGIHSIAQRIVSYRIVASECIQIDRAESSNIHEPTKMKNKSNILKVSLFV